MTISRDTSKPYRLLTPDGPIDSPVPGTLGGYRPKKIYGRLDCPSAKRALAKGHYKSHRVFFADEPTAIACGYRPCASCLRAEYLAWKAAQPRSATARAPSSPPDANTTPLPFTRDAARAAHVWHSIDRVSGDDATTAWKRIARYRQSEWRIARSHPIGASPYAGGESSVPIGSRLALEHARASGANFVTPAALAAAHTRIANPEPHEMLAADRLFADLLSSMPLCFNLFGDLAADPTRAASAARTFWPDAPTGPTRIRFEHSPARRDPTLLGNRSAFDAMFEIDTGSDTRAIIGIETKYHEHALAETAPRAPALARYADITERSNAFLADWRDRVVGTDLQQIWLDHLLLLAMLQHPSRRWTWGRFVLVYPSENPSFTRAAARYRAVLRDPSTFGAHTIESLLDAPDAIPDDAAHTIRRRYFGAVHE